MLIWLIHLGSGRTHGGASKQGRGSRSQVCVLSIATTVCDLIATRASIYCCALSSDASLMCISQQTRGKSPLTSRFGHFSDFYDEVPHFLTSKGSNQHAAIHPQTVKTLELLNCNSLCIHNVGYTHCKNFEDLHNLPTLSTGVGLFQQHVLTVIAEMRLGGRCLVRESPSGAEGPRR